MKMKMKLIALAVMSVVSAQAVSENVIRVSAPVQKASSATWRAASPIVSEWDVLSTTCAEWTPEADTVDDGISFTQTRACNKDESRTTQQREYNAQLDQYRNVGSPATESRTVSEVESQNAVGTKQVASTLKIINPIAGVDGIYQVTDSKSGNTFNAYVNMTYDGGYWVLAAYWTSPSQFTRTNAQLIYRGKALSTYSAAPSTYPVIPSGIINQSSRGLLRSENSGWISLFGQWQSFDLPNAGEIKTGYLATTSSGNKTIYPRSAGWGGNVEEVGTFGFWSTNTNTGACGGSGRAGTSLICPSSNFTNWASHVEGSAKKFFYLKGE